MKSLIPLEQALPEGARHLPESPRVLRSLRRRGVLLSPRDGETRETYQARMETALMALFRDRRGEEEFEALYEYSRPAVLQSVLAEEPTHEGAQARLASYWEQVGNSAELLNLLRADLEAPV